MADSKLNCEGGSDVGCASCAYRQGSVTRNEPYNVLRAEIAAEGGLPFHCHRSFPFLDRAPEKSELVVCEGWKRAVAEKAKDPEWRRKLTGKRAIARLAMGLIDEFADAKDAVTKRGALADLRLTIDVLFGRRGRRRKAA